MSLDKRKTFDRLALGCISYLESFPECRNVTFQGNEPAQGMDFAGWERRNNPCKLPPDLKAFFSIFNGFILSWNVEVGDKIEVVGEMRLNKLDSIVKCNTEFIVQEKLPEDIVPPTFKSSLLYSIDTACPMGEVVLLYRMNGNVVSEEPEIWILDQSACLSYLCRSFTHYLRLLVVHLGIKGWQGVFMDQGWSINTQLWMGMYCKERLIVDRHYRGDMKPHKRV